ncbi:hypothetical protein HAX54_025141 [Datura stramonium]|uniref:Uncharacterized protein n=1 Tax=Datura stramonium TaxID=4076 RepID=A0ABS8S7H9_DATST|nr:hypothetical protein [Datura stramonium]
MDIESKKMSHHTLMALSKYLQKKRYSVIEKATAEGTEEVASDAVGDNFISYALYRQRIGEIFFIELKVKSFDIKHISSCSPLCDPMLVLEFSLPVLESCPMQTIELFLSGNIPADLVNSYLKQHAPDMQATYLQLMLAMNENTILGICRMKW